MWDSPKAFSPEGQAKKVYQTKERKLDKKRSVQKVQIPHHTPGHLGSRINIDLSKVMSEQVKLTCPDIWTTGILLHSFYHWVFL